MTYVGQQPATTFDSGIQDRFTGLTTNTVTLNHEISAEEDILVVWNNIVQDKNTYSVGGTGNKTLTLGGTLVSADVVTVYYLNKVMQSVNPTAGSVNTDQLATNAVTNAKMADDAIGVAELSATGTASSSTFLRGDNAWATAGGNNTPAFSVRNTSNQDVTHGSENLVTLSGEILDTDSAFASNKFTPQEAGKYFIAFQLGGSDDTHTSSNLAYVVLKIRKNGSGYQSKGVINFNNNQARQATYSIQAIVDLNGSSDYVDFSAEVGTTDSSTARFMDDYARASGFKLIGA